MILETRADLFAHHFIGGGMGSLISDFEGATQTAQQHSGGSGSSDMFSSALGMLQGKQSQLQNEDVDEGHMVNQHQKYYGGGGGGGGGGGRGGRGGHGVRIP